MPELTSEKSRPPYVRIIRNAFLGIASLAALLVIAASVYTFTHKEEIRKRFVAEINNYLLVQVDVRKIDISLLRRFPHASIRFRDVATLTPGRAPGDPELIKAESITFLFRLDAFFKKEFRISKIELNNAILNLIRFQDGSSNYDILKPATGDESQSLTYQLDAFRLRNVRISYHERKEQVLAVVTAWNTTLTGSFRRERFGFLLAGDLITENIAYEGTVYFGQKEMEVQVPVVWDLRKETLAINKGRLAIGALNLLIDGSFNISSAGTLSSLAFSIDKAPMGDLLSLIPAKYANQAGEYIKSGNIGLKGELNIQGKAGQPDILKVEFNIDDGSLQYPGFILPLDGLMARGSFTLVMGDATSDGDLRIHEFKAGLGRGKVEGRLRLIDGIKVSITASLKAEIRPQDFEQQLSASGIVKPSGKLLLDILVNRSFDQGADIGFTTLVTDGFRLEAIPILRFEYLGMLWDNLEGKMLSDGMDTELKLEGSVAGDRFSFIGNIAGLLPAILDSSRHIGISGKLSSDHIPLDQFLLATGNSSGGAPDGIVSSIDLDLDLKKVSSRYINGNNVKGKIKATGDAYTFQNLGFGTLQGNVVANGMLDKTDGKSHHAIISAKLSHIDISELFKEYENFGQDELTYNNIGGFVGGTVEIDMDLDTSYYPIPATINSRLKLKVSQGKVVNYEPLTDLAKFIKTGDLSRVEIEAVENEIIIRNEQIIIPEMEVRTNAINVTLSGIHRFDNVIDYHFRVLLSEVLGSEARKAKMENEEFGYVEDDGLGKTSLFLHLTGTVDNPVFRYDKRGVQAKIATDLQKEKVNIREILKEEFRWMKQDSVKKAEKKKAKAKGRDEGEFIIEWE